jgi:hypothetical protein
MLLFTAGVVVGQRTQISTLQRYLAAAAKPRVLDWMLLQGEINALRDYAGYGDSGIAPPRFFYDEKTDMLTAFEVVNGNMLGKQPSGAVRDKLSETARHILTDLRISIPDLPEQNFQVEFKNLVGDGPVDFGEYKNGKLILH